MKTKFFTFNQNNSGGYFVIDLKYGIGEIIIIEAENSSNAIKRLYEIGENVSGFSDYCDCCGERWSDYMNDEAGKDVPSLYDDPIEKVVKSWYRNGAHVHYADNSFKYFEFKEKTIK